MGCITFELATGRKAFNGLWKISEYAETKETPKVAVPKWPDIFQAYLSESIRELLNVDSQKRPSASEVCVIFAVYSRLLRPHTDTFRGDVEMLPSYPELKAFVQQLPSQPFDHEPQQKTDTDEDSAIELWNDLIEMNQLKRKVENKTAQGIELENSRTPIDSGEEEKYNSKNESGRQDNEPQNVIVRTLHGIENNFGIRSNYWQLLPNCTGRHRRPSLPANLHTALVIPSLMAASFAVSAPSSPVGSPTNRPKHFDLNNRKRHFRSKKPD